MKKFLLLLVAMVASLSAWADVEINESNFPDDNFRNWLLEQSYGSDGVLTDEEIAGITEIDVNGIHTYDLTGIEHFTALTHLDCSSNSLEALDLSHNTALTHLDCSSNSLEALDLSHNIALTELQCLLNQLTALDLSYNIELKYLDCMNNQLTALDLSYNIALTKLQCMDNQLTALDLSHNTELKYLDCSNNPLTALDLSQNTALITLDCSNNQLTALDVSHNTALVGLNCSINQINGENMEALVASLPTVDVVNNFGWNGDFSVINLDSETEQNIITAAQVTTARGKNWTVYGYKNYRWQEYDGSYPVVSYIDENREMQSHEAIVLTGNETSLGAEGQESWYVAKDTLNYTQTITIAGDVHLILADSAVMNIGTKAFPLSGYGINGNEHEETTLTIYSQTLDDDTAGHLNINTGNDCIYINGDYAQHGGNVTANSTYWSGIALWNNLTLTGGTLYVTSSKKAINTVENVDILGGKFSAIGGDKGIYTMEGDVTLGWKNADDEITISSLAYGAPRCTMKIVDGQAFVDSVKNIYDSTTPSNTLWALTNVTLRPYNPRYTFNSTTGELALLWGEFNKNNKWGDDVTAEDVLSVTAIDQVSFTGNCS
ncbi:MAG: carbohydrate-binding domain-containing protein, partial [Muribaculaceae bacterium]|nr:carbohydrate-binding domain-containing protein [Muribaculaceae bacterium]